MNTWQKLLETVKDVAPTLAGAAATMVTGGNPAAGAIVASLARKLTGSDSDDLDDIAGQILGDPEKLQAFRLEMRKSELEELKLRTLDVQDARKTLNISRGAIVISTVVVVGYFIATLVVMTVSIPETSQNLSYLLLGNLGTGFGMVLTFWLGSSVGSKEKDKTMSLYMEAARKDQEKRVRDG
ncbi:MAG TPA: hypothetical protein ENK00_01465 [Chromatiales bacterium]|nr:hypothetical protein [Chromatiales bacterium]